MKLASGTLPWLASWSDTAATCACSSTDRLVAMRLPAGGRVASGDTASLLAGGATRSDKRLTLLSFSSSSCASAASAAVLGAPRPKRLAKLAPPPLAAPRGDGEMGARLAGRRWSVALGDAARCRLRDRAVSPPP